MVANGRHRKPIDPSLARRLKKRAKRPPLSSNDYRRLRNKILPVVCSDPWADYCVIAADACGIQPSSKNVVKSLIGLGIYPPNADHSHMRPCRCPSCVRRDSDGYVTCQRLWPAHYINSRGLSYECALERSSPFLLASLPSSPGIIDMARMKAARKRGE